MEQSTSSSRRREEPEFSLREWGLKGRISRENTLSRRFSASFIRREDNTKSFRSNITISSTASSPGYTLREEIDPATYSFTTALKALQARSVYSWECLSPDGFALNSKWNEAEKYICNPLSGEVPMECLSAKTLSGRSFRSLTSRITMSAPLVYPSHSKLLIQTKPYKNSSTLEDHEAHFPIQEKKVWSMNTRDVGTQSTPADLSSSSPSPAPTPSIEERSIEKVEDSPINSDIAKFKSGEKVEVRETKSTTEEENDDDDDLNIERKKGKQKFRCKQGGCLSLSNMWMGKKQREKQKPRKKNIFLYIINGC